MNEKTKALIGREDICEYLHIEKSKFYELIKIGLPIVKTDLGWISHKDRIDEFLLKQVDSGTKKK